MGERVIYLYLASLNESWYELSEQEQDAMLADVNESLDAVGGRRIVSARCEWSTPDFQFFGVEEYPGIGALREHMERQREIGFTDYLEETYVVGTPGEGD